MSWDGLSSALGLISGGSVRAIVVASQQRSRALPDIPTAIESGLPDFESSSWYGVTVPAGTPDPVVRKLSESIVRVLHTPEVNNHLTRGGAEVIASSPQELAAYIVADTARWKKVIDLAKIKVETP
jgi:tripartite-type tricarboxylate transporter receptor subunit TctC